MNDGIEVETNRRGVATCGDSEVGMSAANRRKEMIKKKNTGGSMPQAMEPTQKSKRAKWAKRAGAVLAALVLVVCAAFAIAPATAASTSNTGGFSMANVISSVKMFYGCGEIEGQNGTTYNSNIIDAEYANIDTDSNPGYLSVKDEDNYNVKYAVCIWGINHDTCQDADGNTITAGLTFGPATGSDYTDSYKAHLTQSEFESGENGVCLHWMTWEEIVLQCKEDPTVFEECLENGCTHSVELVLNSTIIRTDYAGKMFWSSVFVTFMAKNLLDCCLEFIGAAGGCQGQAASGASHP